jgi:uncharacterized membrane protein
MAERNVDVERESPGTQYTETSIGLDENIASAIAYALGFFSGIVLFFLEKDNQQVRWHAAQSMVVFGTLIVGGWVLNAVLWTLVFSTFAFGLWSFVSLLTTALWLGVLVLWVYLVVTAYGGKTVRVPIAAGVADGLVR